jgi:NSS family neurotransmitter:Na+ symporter
MRFLNNQDWVWSVALMVAGLFFSIAAIRHGVRRFRETQLNHTDSDIRVGVWWEVVIGALVPLQAVVLLVWWLYQAWQADPGRWLDPFEVGNVGTVLAQFAVLLVVLLLINGRLARASLHAGDRVGS